MARLAARDHGADWVINTDADEFWWPKTGTLKSTLRDVPAELGIVAIERANFLPSAKECGPFYRRMRLRHKTSHTSLGERLPPKVCHRAFHDVVVADGNHSIATRESAVRIESDVVEILHFPMRTYDQFERKIRLGGAALNRNARLASGIGKTWRYLYAEYQAGRLEQYYRSEMMDDETARARLRDGSLIEERCLEQYLDRILGAAGTRSRTSP